MFDILQQHITLYNELCFLNVLKVDKDNYYNSLLWSAWKYKRALLISISISFFLSLFFQTILSYKWCPTATTTNNATHKNDEASRQRIEAKLSHPPVTVFRVFGILVENDTLEAKNVVKSILKQICDKVNKEQLLKKTKQVETQLKAK